MAKRKLPYVVERPRADGTIAYRGYADDADGVRVFSVTFDTEDEAYAAALRMRGEARNLAAADSLDEAIDALLVELRVKRTPGTVRWYSDHFRAICRLIPGETGLHAITRATVEQFIKDRLAPDAGGRRVTASTVNADLRALHRVFAHAIRRGVVRENPVRQVDRPRYDQPAMDWFTADELRAAIAKMVDERMRDVVLLLALTGIRRSEAARLRPEHVRVRVRQVVVPGKTRTRVVPMSDDLVEPCRRLLATAGEFLLPGGVHAIDDLFRAAKEACGDRRMHPHSMRHTFCSALIRAGVRLDVVMRLADHRDIKTTMRYAHEVGAEGVEAVARLRLVPPAESGPAAAT